MREDWCHEIIKGLDDSYTHERCPNTIHLHFGKKRITRLGEPFGENLPTIFFGRQFKDTRIRHPGRQVLAADGMRNLSFLGIPDKGFSAFTKFFGLGTGEKSSEAIIVVLRPSLEGMVMAFGALDSGT